MSRTIICLFYIIVFFNELHAEDLLENAPEWIRIRDEYKIVTSGSPNNAKVIKAKSLMDQAGKQPQGKEPPLAYGTNLLTMCDFTTKSISTLQSWNNNQPAQNIQAVLNIASAAAVFIPVAGPVISTILQLISVMMTFGIETGPSTEEIFTKIVSDQFNSAEMSDLKALLEEEKEKFKNTRSYISIVNGRADDACLDGATRGHFFSITDEENTEFWPQAKSRFDDIFKQESRYLDAFNLLVGICDFATQRYIYLTQILGIGAKQKELGCTEGDTLYQRAFDEIYIDLQNSMEAVLSKLRKPPSGAMKFVKYLKTSSQNGYIEAWLKHTLFAQSQRTFNNLPLFSHDYDKGDWKEWKMCNENQWAKKFIAWIDSGGWDPAGLSQLQMICSDDNSQTLGTAAWGSQFPIECSNKIIGFENCIPHHGTDFEGYKTYYSDPICQDFPELAEYGECSFPDLAELVGQNGIRIKCSDGLYQKAEGSQCQWEEISECQTNFAVCGFNVKATPYAGDDTGINDVALKCCDTNDWNNQHAVYWSEPDHDEKFNYHHSITDNTYFIAFIFIFMVVSCGLNIHRSIRNANKTPCYK